MPKQSYSIRLDLDLLETLENFRTQYGYSVTETFIATARQALIRFGDIPPLEPEQQAKDEQLIADLKAFGQGNPSPQRKAFDIQLVIAQLTEMQHQSALMDYFILPQDEQTQAAFLNACSKDADRLADIILKTNPDVPNRYKEKITDMAYIGIALTLNLLQKEPELFDLLKENYRLLQQRQAQISSNMTDILLSTQGFNQAR